MQFLVTVTGADDLGEAGMNGICYVMEDFDEIMNQISLALVNGYAVLVEAKDHQPLR